MEDMLLDIDEKDRRRTLQELDVTGLTLDPTPEGRKAIDISRTFGACPHGGIKPYCPQCCGDELEAEREARKQRRRDAA